MPPSRNWLPALVVTLGSVLLTLPELVWPFGRDQGNYAYPAWVWLDGGMLYRDVLLFKPPATAFVHALALWIFGHSMTAVRILDIGWTALTALAILALGRLWFDRVLTGVFAGIAYVAFYMGFDYWTTCQTDGWMNLPAILGLLAATLAVREEQPGRSAGLLLLSGIGIGITAFFKYTGLAILAPVAVLLFLPLRRLPLRLILVLLGVASVFAGCALWLTLRDAWPGFLDSQLGLLPHYVDDQGRTEGLGGFRKFFRDMWYIIPLRPVGAAFFLTLLPSALLLWRGERRGSVFALLAWAFAGILGCVAQDKFFRYHYLMFFPAVSMGAGLALDAGLERLGRSRVLIAAVLAGLVVAFSEVPGGYRLLGQVARGQPTLERHWRSGAYSGNAMSLRDNLLLADYLVRATPTDANVFIWGFDPMVNFVAERKTVSRFLYNYPFAVSWHAPGYEDELVSALQADVPLIFVVGSRDAAKRVTGTEEDSKALLPHFTKLTAFLAEHFEFSRKIGRFDVYRRKG